MNVSATHRSGNGEPVVFFTASARRKKTMPTSRGRLPSLVLTARALPGSLEAERFHLEGHSMGGLTSFTLAHEEGERVLSCVDIEGNVDPEDCFRIDECTSATP